jgi:pilus assembly protein CpaB
MTKNALNIMIAVAVISGLAVMVGVYRFLHGVQQSKQQAAQAVHYVVAGKDLTRGTRLEPQHMNLQQLSGIEAPPGTFASANLVLGRVLNTDLPAGAAIVEGDLIPRGLSDLAGKLAKGYRAVSVLVDPKAHSHRLLHQGDRVDVIVTVSDEDYTNVAAAKLVIQDLEVLHVPGEDSDKEKRQESRKSKVPITLAMLPWQAERLALAQQIGEIQLIVRGYEDAEGVRTSGVSWDTLLPYDKEATKDALAFRAVELYKGNTYSQWRFLGNERIVEDQRPLQAPTAPAGASSGGAQ